MLVFGEKIQESPPTNKYLKILIQNKSPLRNFGAGFFDKKFIALLTMYFKLIL